MRDARMSPFPSHIAWRYPGSPFGDAEKHAELAMKPLGIEPSSLADEPAPHQPKRGQVRIGAPRIGGATTITLAVVTVVLIAAAYVRFGPVSEFGSLPQPMGTAPVGVIAPEPTKPWVTLPPTPSASSVNLAPCRPADVSASVIGWGAAGGTTYAEIRLTPSGPSCAMPSVPDVSISDAANLLLSHRPAAIGGQVALNSSGLIARVGWSSWCGATPAAPMALHLGLEFGSAIVVTLPIAFGAHCEGVPATVSIDPLFVPGG